MYQCWMAKYLRQGPFRGKTDAEADLMSTDKWRQIIKKGGAEVNRTLRLAKCATLIGRAGFDTLELEETLSLIVSHRHPEALVA